MPDRLLLAARKSRKAYDDDLASADAAYERQDHRAREWAERRGDAIIGVAADTVSSQTKPWERPELKKWMTTPAKLAMIDGFLVSNVDRWARARPIDWHHQEHWLIVNGKFVLVAVGGPDGVQFPPRDGTQGIIDKQLWDVFKDAARREWEAIRDRYADAREIVSANGAAFGRPPFGYTTSGLKYHKSFVPHPVNAPLAREAFERVGMGRTATSTAIWLSAETGQPWRVKRVREMIQNRSYLGERDGHAFEALISRELWDAANAAMSARSFGRPDRGGRRTVHMYSGLIYCPCGAVYYRHKTEGVGREKYRCSAGRDGSLSGQRCGNPILLFADVNAAVDALMLADGTPEIVMMTTGGDAARQSELADLRKRMTAATARGDMDAVASLAAEYKELDAQPAAPIVTKPHRTGRTNGEAWEQGSLEDRRAILKGRMPLIRVVVELRGGEVSARLEGEAALCHVFARELEAGPLDGRLDAEHRGVDLPRLVLGQCVASLRAVNVGAQSAGQGLGKLAARVLRARCIALLPVGAGSGACLVHMCSVHHRFACTLRPGGVASCHGRE